MGAACWSISGSSNLQIEIREVAFNGTVTAVPEPSGTVLGLAGLAVLAAAGTLRRRA